MPKLPSDHDSEDDAEEGPPQPYNSWEEYFDDFDRQLEKAPPITVRKRIGNPKIRPANEIPDSEIEAELDQLIELLYENNVVIDFIHDIEDRAAYIFITEELLDETMDDIRIPDLYSHFVYEEFHPNDEDDINVWSSEFLDTFFKEGTETFLSQSEIMSCMMPMVIASARKNSKSRSVIFIFCIPPLQSSIMKSAA